MKHQKKNIIPNEHSQIRRLKNRHIKENLLHKQTDFLGRVVTLSDQDNEFNAIVDSDRISIEQSCKGIFACPKYINFFSNMDDVSIK